MARKHRKHDHIRKPEVVTVGAGVAAHVFENQPIPDSGTVILPTINIGKGNGKPFDPNEGIDAESAFKVLLPSLESIGVGRGAGIVTIDQYVEMFSALTKSEGGMEALMKSLAIPPSMQSFASTNSMPDLTSGGVYPWPDLQPIVLRKIVRENIAPIMIINNRVDDVLKYANLSSHPWKPGWKIQLRESGKHPTKDDHKNMREAEMFIQNCNIETGLDVRKRDAQGYHSFRTYLAALVRDTLTYDGMATFTDMAADNKVKAFKAVSAGNIRLAGKKGYKGNRDIFAVGVDDTGKVAQDPDYPSIRAEFTRDDLVWYVRNPRADVDIYGYGYPEPTQAIRLIKGIQDAFDVNFDTFTRNSTPNGMLLLKGMGFTQKQIDALGRIWNNLKRGVTKSWALPVMSTGKDGEIEVLDLSRLKGNEVYYKELLNMSFGAFCCVYRFPVDRIGYKVSGMERDNKQQEGDQGKTSKGKKDDPGLEPLLSHIELMINEYLVWNRWPNLQFSFNGKNPKEDAREYEFKTNAMTLKERRAAADLTSLEDDAPPGFKDIAKIMDMCPTDPNVAGVYQSVVAAKLAKLNKKKEGEARFSSKKDPAASEEHGHLSGVRRDSAQERKDAE